MKAQNRWLAWLMVFALIVAACGDGDGEEAEQTTTTTAAATTTTAGGSDTTETTAAEPMEIATDFGVDLEAGVIRVGIRCAGVGHPGRIPGVHRGRERQRRDRREPDRAGGS
jgi:hypothetical protein